MRTITFFSCILILSNCGSSDNSSNDIPKMSDNTKIQSAYEKCVIETQAELEEDNPGTEADIMKMMKDMAFDTCNSLVVTTCTNNPESNGCEMIMKQYGS